ncbi:biofilm development regulator YmgB/AriR family protein [Superficieibacter sp. BNK-5]|uniref:biofilm development regulator YmgB/AriR family protein n=1 Tax=unclassified Superficieibacter TaxID=2645744 RepID=UPI0023E22216|nr:biofilm development regulator YmgB/AriR family protein [Superficieibacter sp. HKU1]WES70522.1 biofilm development regulator YmgB/AriR family protein [Superficieibacter sp. HKU1]
MPIQEVDQSSPLSFGYNHDDAGQKVISEIMQDLLSRKTAVNNKDIILELVVRLETEKDIVKLDIYRSALEMVVLNTPDDI